MCGGLEEFWFPVLEMNCGCPEPEEPETTIFFCFSPFLQHTLHKKSFSKSKSNNWGAIKKNLQLAG
jgi:hypothetical protein